MPVEDKKQNVVAIEADESDSPLSIREMDIDRLFARLEWGLSGALDYLMFDGHADLLANIFKSNNWLGTWCEKVANKRGQKIWVLTGSVDGIPVISLPLVETRGRFVTRVEFAAQDVSDQNGFVLHQEIAEQLSGEHMTRIAEQVSKHFPNADCIRLRKVLFADLVPVDNRFRWKQDFEQSHLSELSGNWEVDAAKFMGKSTCESLKRKLKNLKKMGDVCFVEVTGQKARAEAIATLIEWKAEQLADLGLASIFSDPEFCEFLSATVSHEGKDGVHLHGMFIDGEPVALCHLLHSENRWLLYQTAYASQKSAKYSPGLHLLLYLMETASNQGVAIFDFGIGNESYKMRYTSKSLPLYNGYQALSWKGWVLCRYADAVDEVRYLTKKSTSVRSAALWVLSARQSIKPKIP